MKGKIKVSVLYPNKEGARFDMDYYINKHMPIVQELLGDAILGFSVESGLAGGGNSPAPYIAIGVMYFEDIPAFQAAFAPNMKQMAADLPNFTDLTSVVQISKVLA